ncbi:hypothetical protein HZ326_12969 [Fusarium oxysporum f. sp. albedinis]|nr:hypothetical protein HZ326_12969 [Fusarium oxysporum f. sp. albedinis]
MPSLTITTESLSTSGGPLGVTWRSGSSQEFWAAALPRASEFESQPPCHLTNPPQRLCMAPGPPRMGTPVLGKRRGHKCEQRKYPGESRARSRSTA